MIEVWKDIKGYEGLYQVSTLGNVKSLERMKLAKNESFQKVKEMILKPKVTKKGYLEVQLCKDGKIKNYKVHRLVAEAFIPNPHKYPCVNHKNGNRQENFVWNLEWCTYAYNNTYNDKHLKFAKSIFCIELNKIFPSIREAEHQTGVYHGNITKCLKGRYKTAGGYHWEYAPK